MDTTDAFVPHEFTVQGLHEMKCQWCQKHVSQTKLAPDCTVRRESDSTLPGNS